LAASNRAAFRNFIYIKAKSLRGRGCSSPSEVGGGKHNLPLFATDLAGLGLLGWRRKKKTAPLNP